MNAYDLGREAARARLAPSLNPFPDYTHNSTKWRTGWIHESGEMLRDAPKPAPRQPALILPHPSLTGQQIDLLCRREGLALAHLGRERFVLVQTSALPQTTLRIATPPDLRRERRPLDRPPQDPEAA